MSYQFQGQHPSEDVILVTHQHPFVLFRSFLLVVGILLLPFVAYLFMSFGTLLSWVVSVSLVLGVVKAYLAVYVWVRTICIVTNERVMFMHQKSIISREYTECPFARITQVSHAVKGFEQTFFGFGTISITASSDSGTIKIPNLPDPFGVQETIQEYAGQAVAS